MSARHICKVAFTGGAEDAIIVLNLPHFCHGDSRGQIDLRSSVKAQHHV